MEKQHSGRPIWWPKAPQFGISPINLCVPIWTYDDRYSGQPIVRHVITGPYHLVRNKNFIVDNSIEVILCIRDPAEKPFLRTQEQLKVEFQFLDVPSDVRQANVIPYFNQATEIIKGLVENERNVLVCCSDGIDKSASFVAAYLMNIYALKAVDAITFVQNQRYCATPSANGYRLKLLEYEPICAAKANSSVVQGGESKKQGRSAEDESEVMHNDELEQQSLDQTGTTHPSKRVREDKEMVK
ncbi:phosphatases II [Coemansia reversa NRRL 1564]|uniref:Phosphatases II n=1 Tax=Coemansia reversa (strain ATCC 12441 / NRRL 1564) TaxID=763665 RepID=A0A2G5B5I4_COERN|nr:phosphatases II [Coemansia reversa NRRL 1564]|eukprot:PIA14261.1 phosphatases II [Coemansia reversa NRRL 1564]